MMVLQVSLRGCLGGVCLLLNPESGSPRSLGLDQLISGGGLVTMGMKGVFLLLFIIYLFIIY